MAVDIFLKLDGIDGESQDEKHKGEIEISSYSFGASTPSSASGGDGGGSGKVRFEDFQFTQVTNKASPLLLQNCASGQHIKEGLLTVRKAGGGGSISGGEFLKITLDDIIVTSFQEGASLGEDLPAEQVSLNFQKITYSYQQQSAGGVLLPPETVVIDLSHPGGGNG